MIARIFRKMQEDKKTIRAYIKEHGTLNGFSNDSIQFAKPI